MSSKDKWVCFQIPDCLRPDPWYNKCDDAQPESGRWWPQCPLPSPARRRGSGGGGCPYSCHSCD